MLNSTYKSHFYICNSSRGNLGRIISQEIEEATMKEVSAIEYATSRDYIRISLGYSAVIKKTKSL